MSEPMLTPEEEAQFEEDIRPYVEQWQQSQAILAAQAAVIAAAEAWRDIMRDDLMGRVSAGTAKLVEAEDAIAAAIDALRKVRGE